MAGLGTNFLIEPPPKSGLREQSFSWSNGHVPLIGPHSEVKLSIYFDYILRYIRERSSLKMDRFRLNVVDGFCGGGAFRNSEGAGVAGSPLIVLSAVEAARAELNVGRLKPLEIELRLYCYDVDNDALDRLRAELTDAGYGQEIGRSIFIERANFSQIARRLIKRLADESGRTIFLLDQLGYGQVSFDTLRHIFSELKRPEVILTFAYEWLTRFVSEYGALSRALDRISVKPPPESVYLASVGGKSGAARFIQGHLITEFRKVAPFLTPFFLTSRTDGVVRGSNLKYWLVHLAAHERANDVMKRVHWGVQNHSAHYQGVGLEMMGFDPNRSGNAVTAYMFGKTDQERTKAALIEDIPRFMSKYEDWRTVANLWEQTCNETPSTSRMQIDVLSTLKDDLEVEVLGASGGAKRGGAIQKGDMIRLAPQKSFSFMRPVR